MGRISSWVGDDQRIPAVVCFCIFGISFLLSLFNNLMDGALFDLGIDMIYSYIIDHAEWTSTRGRLQPNAHIECYGSS